VHVLGQDGVGVQWVGQGEGDGDALLPADVAFQVQQLEPQLKRPAWPPVCNRCRPLR
jgi:hypothetical protein